MSVESETIDISFIVPALNESKSLPTLFDEIDGVATDHEISYEIILIDDGSSDQTSELVVEWKESYPKLRSVRFLRNQGKSRAYIAGFRRAKGTLVVTLDADLQDDPDQLPLLLEALEDGADLVVGRKAGRLRNEPLKAIVSWPFNALLVRLFGLKIRDANSGFKAMRRRVAEALVPLLYGDLYRFIPHVAHTIGFSVAEVEVEHRKRIHGHSKFGPIRFWTGLLDAGTMYFLLHSRTRPLHFFASFGLLPLLVGTGLEIYALSMKLSGSSFQQHIAAIIIGVLLITLGVQMVFTGLLAELITAYWSKEQSQRSDAAWLEEDGD